MAIFMRTEVLILLLAGDYFNYLINYYVAGDLEKPIRFHHIGGADFRAKIIVKYDMATTHVYNSCI